MRMMRLGQTTEPLLVQRSQQTDSELPTQRTDFNGSSWIETPQYRLLDAASNATISAWVVVNPGTGGQLLSAGDARSGYDPIHFRFGVQNAGSVHFQNCLVGNGDDSHIGEVTHSNQPLANLTASTWHQIVVVLGTTNPLGTFTIYVDGLRKYFQVGSDDGISPFTKIAYDTDMRFLIGAIEARPNFSQPAQFWSGKIDDIRIYN